MAVEAKDALEKAEVRSLQLISQEPERKGRIYGDHTSLNHLSDWREIR